MSHTWGSDRSGVLHRQSGTLPHCTSRKQTETQSPLYNIAIDTNGIIYGSASHTESQPVAQYAFLGLCPRPPLPPPLPRPHLGFATAYIIIIVGASSALLLLLAAWIPRWQSTNSYQRINH